MVRFSENLLNMKCVFDFLYNSVSSTTYSKDNSAKYYLKRTQTSYSCHIVMDLEFSGQFFEK